MYFREDHSLVALSSLPHQKSNLAPICTFRGV